MADPAAAERLKRALRVAMTEAGYDTWIGLALEAGVSPTTVENWIYGRTVPRAAELRKVGELLRPHTSPGALEAAYAGLPPEEPPLIETLRDLVPELHELVVLMRAQADQEVLQAVRDALAERRRGSRPPPDVRPPDDDGDRLDRHPE